MLKVYDKTFQQRQAGNLKVESNLIRVELVFLDRMLDRMYSTINRITKILNDSINSGVIGSKAVLELLKYPAYADMVSAKIRERAFEGSKSSAEQAFDRLKESELKEAEQGLASVYLQGFHLRNIEKQVNAFKKPSAWNPDEQTA